MNSILAQIRKDLYLNKYIIIAYLAYYISGIALKWDILKLFNSPGIGPRASGFFQSQPDPLLLLVIAFIFFTDPDTHTDAFCHTRPLKARKRALAKIILIGGVVFLPMFASNLLYTFRYGGSYLPMVIRDIAVNALFLTGIGIASLSRSIPRLIINIIGIMMGSLITYNVLRPLVLDQAWDAPYQSISLYWFTNYSSEIIHPIIGTAFIAIAFLPVRIRRHTLKVGLAAIILYTVTLIGIYRPGFDIIDPLQAQPNPTEYKLSQKAFFEPDVYVGQDGPSARDIRNILSFELEAIHSEPGTDVKPWFLSGQLTVEGKTLYPSYDFRLYKQIDDPLAFSPNNFESGFNKMQLLNKDQFESKDPLSFAAIDISDEVLDGLKGKKATYEGRIGLITAKYSKIATVPLDPNASFKSEYYFGKIDAVNKQDKQIDVSVTVAATMDPLNRESPIWTRIPCWTSQGNSGREFLLLYNPKTNEALIPETLRTESDYITRSQQIWNAVLSKYELSFELSDTITDEWLENAEILIIEKKVVRTQDEDFTVQNITL